MKEQPEYQKHIAVSVIVPVYNAAKYLPQCLDSICNQTLQNIEIICVDDGSTDNSLEILERYAEKDSRFQLLQQKNASAGAARNKGMSLARGEYLSFLDADDFFVADFLEVMYQKAKRAEADIVVCAAAEFDTKMKRKTHMPYSLKEKYLPANDVFSYLDMPDYIFNSFQNWAWNKLFRTEFVYRNKINFQQTYRTNDLFFTCKALVLAEKITTVKKDLICYRVNHENHCQTTNDRAPLDFYQAFYQLKIELYEMNLYQLVEKSFLNWALQGCIHNVFSIKDRQIRNDVVAFLSQQGLENLGVKYMNYTYCHRKSAQVELFCVNHNLWSVLSVEQRLKQFLKRLYDKV